MDTLFRDLFSQYVIDGVVMDSTPADMLRECCAPEDWERLFPEGEQCCGTIVDETGDSAPLSLKYEFSKVEEYSRTIVGALSERVRNSVNPRHPDSSSLVIFAETVLGHLLNRKPVSLDELTLRIRISWDCTPVGNMAAFYKAVEAVSGYAYELGIRFTDFVLAEETGTHEFRFEPAATDEGEKLPSEVTDGGILIYVPFDVCPHKLGGSLFSETLGGGDEVEPVICDTDYFIDSYEVVHDLVEDGVALGGAVVGRGGLLTAVEGLLGERFSLDMDLGGIQNTYMEDDPVRILFSEIPGLVLQISEDDKDYVDSQFLLQDIAYYPLGRPEPTDGGGRKVRLSVESRDDLSRILSSLLEGHKSEDPEISNFAEGAETERE